MKIQRLAFRLALVAGACAVLNGCLSTTPMWDRTFGNSVNQITAMQVLNPNASQNADPVTGMDGVAATAAQQNYEKSFTAPPAPTNMFTIGVSGGNGSNSGN